MSEQRIILEANSIVDAELARALKLKKKERKVHFTERPGECSCDSCRKPCAGHAMCSTIPDALVTTIWESVTCRVCIRKRASVGQ